MIKPLLRAVEISDGINVIIDNRWVAMFPLESRVQVNHLVESVNRAVEEVRQALTGREGGSE